MIDEDGVHADSKAFFERLDSGKLSPAERNCLVAAHAYFSASLALRAAPYEHREECKKIKEALHQIAEKATMEMMMEQPHFPKPSERN
jgi:Flp pilus assembly protein CpaB